MQTFGRLNDGRTIGYGLGLSLNVYRGLRTVGHGGDEFGYLAAVVRFPDQHVAVTAFCNASTIYPRPLANKVAEVVLGLDALAPAARGAPTQAAESELAALAGTYWNPITGQVRRFVIRDGQLLARGSATAFVALGDGRFRAGEGPMELLFPSPRTGAAQELHIPPPVFDAPFSCRSWSGGCGGPWSERAVFTRDGSVAFSQGPESVRRRVSQR